MTTTDALAAPQPTPPSSTELKSLVGSLERAATAVEAAKMAAAEVFQANASRLDNEFKAWTHRAQAAAHASIAALDARVRDATPTLNGLESRANALAQTLAEAQSQAAAAPGQLEAALAGLEKRFAQLDQERAERVQQEAKRWLVRAEAAAQQTIAGLDAQVRKATPTLDAMEARANALERAQAEAQAQAEAAPEHLQRALSSLELQFAHRDEERTRAHEAARVRAERALQDRQAEVNTLVIRLSAHLEGAARREATLIAALRSEQAAINSERDAVLSSLSSRITQAEARATALRAENEALVERIAALEERTVAVEKKKVFGIF